MADYQLGVIGAGNMAEAILRGVIRSNFLSRNTVVASDPAVDRRRKLLQETGITCEEQNCIPAACPHVLLAVKPQVMSEVLKEVAAC